jgi:CubicO group peptidase (beta-lactamase class C family)
MNYRATQILVLLFAISIPGYNALAQDRVEQIDALLDKYHEYGLFNGAILVADGGKVLYKKGFGEANKEWGIENRTDTKFRIGSVTKQFTAAIILQLVEEGLIDLDASVTNYLPDYPEPQGEQMTINNLLTHTSGIPNYTSLPSFFDFTRDPYEPDSFITVFSGLDLEFEPGSKFNYSNSGYFLLGVIIEHVTGKPFDEVLDERLLDPFDLNDTGYQHHGQIIEHMAAGYNYAAGQYENAPYLDTTIPYSAGMMYSTVEDLFRWNYLLHNGAIFKDTKTLKRMTTPFLNNYGYGIGVFYVPVGEDSIMTIGHSGGIFGFSSILNYMP